MGQQGSKFRSVQHKYPWDKPPEGIPGASCNICGKKHWTDAVSYYNDLLSRALNKTKDDLIWHEVAKFHSDKCPIVLDREVPRISNLEATCKRFKESVEFEE